MKMRDTRIEILRLHQPIVNFKYTLSIKHFAPISSYLFYPNKILIILNIITATVSKLLVIILIIFLNGEQLDAEGEFQNGQ